MTSFNPKDLLPKSSTASTTTSKRGGVGSTKTQKDNISEDWTKFGKRQILSIGNKKRHNQHDDIEEDDNIDVGESSSDEEEGRTSAVREKKKRKVVAKIPTTHQIEPKTTTDCGEIDGLDSTVDDIISNSSTKKKKKKKGKKERAKDNNTESTSIEQQPLDENTTDVQQSIAKEVAASNKKSTTANEISNANDKSNTTTDSNTTTNTSTKRKRKKVRSRQKNIRKDNREVKPSHLIIGNEDYKGRPMTKETCEKLGIQQKSEGRKNSKRKGNVEMFDSGQWVGGEDKTLDTAATNDHESAKEDTVVSEEVKQQPKEDGGDTLTRIGDCIVGNSSNIDNDDTNNDDIGENLLSEDSKKKKGKKQKKRKVKNLVVG